VLWFGVLVGYANGMLSGRVIRLCELCALVWCVGWLCQRYVKWAGDTALWVVCFGLVCWVWLIVSMVSGWHKLCLLIWRSLMARAFILRRLFSFLGIWNWFSYSQDREFQKISNVVGMTEPVKYSFFIFVYVSVICRFSFLFMFPLTELYFLFVFLSFL